MWINGMPCSLIRKRLAILWNKPGRQPGYSYRYRHGRYQGEPQLDFARLQRIKDLVKIPLVLHGSSGVPDDAIRQAIELGIRKVNIDTNIREAFVGKCAAL